LGNHFLHNYYTIYDIENSRVGLVLSKNSQIGTIETRSVPWNNDEIIMILAWTLIVIWAAALLYYIVIEPCCLSKHTEGNSRISEHLLEEES